MMMKKVYVEWRPIGVIAGNVPWNYPFHNVFNPMIANDYERQRSDFKASNTRHGH